MTPIRLLLAALALSFAATAAAQEEGIGAIRLRPGVCTLGKSKPVALGALVAAPEAFDGKCVRVMGVSNGRMLYNDRADHDQAMAGPSSAPRAGLYGDPALLDALPQAPTPIEIVGKVDRCAGRPFIMGYCHYVADGVILIVTETRKPDHGSD
jgi:hypothetical protein